MLCIALLCLLAAGCSGCGEQGPKTATGPWNVTVERIDLDKPENQKYIDWAKNRRYQSTFSKPKYFDVEPYRKAYWEQMGKALDPWTYKTPWEKCRPWNETKELVVRETYTSESSGYSEFLVRDKATGKTEQIAKGGFLDGEGGVGFDVIQILGDTRFLYSRCHPDDGGAWWYYLYDPTIWGSICVASDINGDLCDLGNGRYLWNNYGGWDENGRGLYLIDMRAFEAGENDAKQRLFPWHSGESGEIRHLSSDKRFVYMDIDIYKTGRCRGVYDTDTGEQAAFFAMPENSGEGVLIGDDLEYVYNWSGDADDPTIYSFSIIHYDQTSK